MAINDPDYWLDWALENVDCGSRNRWAMKLAAQLRDNRVGKATAEKTLERYARESPRCGHEFTEREALAVCRSVYRREPREPSTSNGKEEQSDLQRKARKRDRELWDKYKKDPLSLSEMEVKRLKASPLDFQVDLMRWEVARSHMSSDELSLYKYCCSSAGRDYWVGDNRPCDCDCVSYIDDRMWVEFDEATNQMLLNTAKSIEERALRRNRAIK